MPFFLGTLVMAYSLSATERLCRTPPVNLLFVKTTRVRVFDEVQVMIEVDEEDQQRKRIVLKLISPAIEGVFVHGSGSAPAAVAEERKQPAREQQDEPGQAWESEEQQAAAGKPTESTKQVKRQASTNGSKKAKKPKGGKTKKK